MVIGENKNKFKIAVYSARNSVSDFPISQISNTVSMGVNFVHFNVKNSLKMCDQCGSSLPGQRVLCGDSCCCCCCSAPWRVPRTSQDCRPLPLPGQVLPRYPGTTCTQSHILWVLGRFWRFLNYRTSYLGLWSLLTKLSCRIVHPEYMYFNQRHYFAGSGFFSSLTQPIF